MDEVKIESKFTTALISKVINKLLKKKLGYGIECQINQIRTTIIDGKAHLHLDVDAEINKEDLGKLIGSIGL